MKAVFCGDISPTSDNESLFAQVARSSASIPRPGCARLVTPWQKAARIDLVPAQPLHRLL